MKTAIRACSISLRELLRQALEDDANPDALFDPAKGGILVVSLSTPEELFDAGAWAMFGCAVDDDYAG